MASEEVDELAAGLAKPTPPPINTLNPQVAHNMSASSWFSKTKPATRPLVNKIWMVRLELPSCITVSRQKIVAYILCRFRVYSLKKKTVFVQVQSVTYDPGHLLMLHLKNTKSMHMLQKNNSIVAYRAYSKITNICILQAPWLSDQEKRRCFFVYTYEQFTFKIIRCLHWIWKVHNPLRDSACT